MAVVDQSVNQSCRQPVVSKDGVPLRKLQVGGNNQALALVAVRNHLEQQLGCVLVQRYTIVVSPEAVEEQREEALTEGLIEGAYPQNAAGLTYGTMSQRRITGEYPDLISVVATNGESGYVNWKILTQSMHW